VSIKDAICAVVAGRGLEAAQMEGAMESILQGQATPAQIAALLVALRMKGETVDELSAAARVMHRHCVPVVVAGSRPLIDTCGTGGDGLHTFNISTAAAIVVAAAGVAVAKHGNRAASSQTGSADVLEALGVAIELSPAHVARCIEQVGIGFMFARLHHPAMKHVGPVRSEIGVRTLFNFLGPLSNPASASHQVIGVSDARLLDTMAQVLGTLGKTRAMVVHGHGGMDEVSLSGPTQVAELRDGNVLRSTIAPEDFGLTTQPNADLRGGDAAHNAALIRALLAGEYGARRDAVVLNAAAALYVAGAAESPLVGAQLAARAIDSGDALRKLDAWVAATKAA
jgi:anthranilate phosphoribosyltransferase